MSGTFRSDPGLPLAANYAVPAAAICRSRSGARRPAASPNIVGQPLAPGELLGDRVNEMDLRVAKVLRFGRTRTNVGFDLYNLFNSSAVLSYNQTFVPGGTWLQPLWC